MNDIYHFFSPMKLLLKLVGILFLGFIALKTGRLAILCAAKGFSLKYCMA